MPKIGAKSNDKVVKMSGTVYKSITAKDPAFFNWLTEDPFGYPSAKTSQHSNNSDANSKSSDSGYSQRVSGKRSKSCPNNSKHSPNKLKSSAKHMSRYVKTLVVEKSDTNREQSDNSSHNYENESNNESINNSTEEDINISDVSSPVKPSMPSIDSNSSPIGHKVVEPIDRRESLQSLVRKSFLNFFDESVIDLEKNIKRSKIRKIEFPLRLKALTALKTMKRSTLEFCHRNSLQNKDNKSKPLVLKMIKMETEFGISFLNSIVLNDENFEENTPIILVLKEELTAGLEPTANYLINVFRKWNQKEICSQTYIFNAFNVEFIESDGIPDDQHNHKSVTESVIWQKDKP